MFSRRNAARTFKNIYRQPCPSRKQPCPPRNPRGGPTCTSRICASSHSRALLLCTRVSTHSTPCEYSGVHCGQGEVDALAFIENFAIEEAVMALLLRL